MLHWANSVDPDEARKCDVSSGSTLFATNTAILDTTVGSINFRWKYDKELRCLNTKGKYGKVTNAEIKWSILANL